jgi:hypothetical protein
VSYPIWVIVFSERYIICAVPLAVNQPTGYGSVKELLSDFEVVINHQQKSFFSDCAEFVSGETYLMNWKLPFK